jgi:cell division protein FtsI/penicillin-binding protein 2
MKLLSVCVLLALNVALPLGTATGASLTLPPKPHARASAVRKNSKKTAVKPAPPVDPTDGDNVDGDDLMVRRAAVAALGTVAGSIVAVDPGSGRILTMVNQKLALKSGFTPCSTIKLVTALAALSERIVQRDTFLYLGRYASHNLTTAIALSNNQYFARLGTMLGYERVMRYARMLGLGEKAGLDILGEQPGGVPDHSPAASGMGMLTAFGEGFLMTPLELAAVLSAIANNGTLYYLQYPQTPAKAEQFTPKVKRELQLATGGISDIKMGMRAAVDYGTGRRAGYDPAEPILGKTGTCTDFRASSHMGWFGSFNEVAHHQIVVVVMLIGSRAVTGPMAAGVAGAVYRNLSEQHYFLADAGKKPDLPEMISTGPCCTAVPARDR